MELRKLQTEEHIKTRALWEAIFTEDSKEFVDYYYAVKAPENEIYVIEQDGRIVSMIHLNPYAMRIGKSIYETHYIVGVATDERYRRRGYMATLLRHALQVMESRGEPFTFLMPASEAIYKPFGFSYIYEQRQGCVVGKRDAIEDLRWSEASKEDCGEIAAFANAMLQKWDVVTWRDARYYQTLLAELGSEGGGILLARREDGIAGVFCYAFDEEREDGTLVLREPLCLEREVLERAVYQITDSETEQAFCTGFGEQTKPMIMAKILHPELALDLEKQTVFLNEVV